MNTIKNFFAPKTTVTGFELQKDYCGHMHATVDITTVKWGFVKKTVTRGIYKKPDGLFWRWVNTDSPVPETVAILAETQIELLAFKFAYDNALKGL